MKENKFEVRVYYPVEVNRTSEVFRFPSLEQARKEFERLADEMHNGGWAAGRLELAERLDGNMVAIMKTTIKQIKLG